MKAIALSAPPVSTGGVVSRFRQRLFHPWSSGDKIPAPRPAAVGAAVPKKQINLQASIAEFLLVNRLRARRKSEPSPEVMERAARIVFITCQNWFAEPAKDPVSHRTRL